MAISQENRYKNGINVTFVVPQTWFLAFHMFEIDNIQNFLLTLKDQILTNKDAKEINFINIWDSRFLH